MRQDLKILYVEDNEHDIIATKRSWRRHKIGHQLMIVRDGEECLDFLFRRGAYEEPSSSPEPSLVLLDLNLPKYSGLEVLEAIRNSEQYKHLPVVIMTSSSMDSDRVESYDLGVNAYIVKPLDYENFSEAIQTINSFWEMVLPAPND